MLTSFHIYTLGIIQTLTLSSLFANCIINNNAKNCPTSGSTLLDDTYPVTAYVISQKPFIESSTSKKLPLEFILSILKANNYSANSPQILVPSDKNSFENLKLELKEKLNNINKYSESILEKVVHVDTQAYRWQQDYFQSFVNLNTGNPTLRKILTYRGPPPSSDAVKKISEASKFCNIEYGNGIDDSKVFGSTHNGHMGGNIEGLPGGLCLVGNNFNKYTTSEFCGEKSNIVSIDTDWLKVGHVDEIIKILPNKKNIHNNECDFSIMAASPRKAIELLNSSQDKNEKIFDVNDLTDPKLTLEISKINDFRTSRNNGSIGQKLCTYYNLQLNSNIKTKLPPDKKDKNKLENKVKQVFNLLNNLSNFNAWGGVTPVSESTQPECKIDELNINAFLNAFNSKEEKQFNELVQKSIDESVKNVISRIYDKLPQCRNKIRVIEVPDLFFGFMEKHSNGSFELARPGIGTSFFPNPTNSVISNETLILPHPQNKIFKNYIMKSMDEIGLKSTFIDTWDYSHLGDGNLHCISQSIPYCLPASNKMDIK